MPGSGPPHPDQTPLSVEEQLRRARGTLEAHLNNSPIAIVEWGPDLRFRRWSKGAERIYGWTAQEMIGQRFDQVDPPMTAAVDLDRAYAHVEELLSRKVSRSSITIRNQRKDGSVCWVEWHASTLFDEAGQLVSVLSQGVEVTERVHAEQDLRAARDRAEAASKAKDRFLATLSHELRTPLTPVRALLSYMAEDVRLPADVRGELALALVNVQSECRLIDDLLDMTRLSRGQVDVKAERFDVQRVLRDVTESAILEVETKQITLEVDLQAHECWALLDPQRMRQVFWNLLSNAIKFTPAGGRIWVSTTNPDPRTLEIEVRDTGVGIAPEQLPKIFEAFERGEARHRYQYTGLGLGLTIAQSLLSRMGGTIEARSDGPGRGSTFKILLGVCDSAPESTDAPVDEQRPEQHVIDEKRADVPQPAAGIGLPILIVEDHPATAEILQRLMSRAGRKAAVARSVAEALKIVGEKQFDLLLCDIGLPDGSGHELLKMLRSRGFASPAVALSGYGMGADIAASKEAGFSEHLVKPVDFRTLMTSIDRAMG